MEYEYLGSCMYHGDSEISSREIELTTRCIRNPLILDGTGTAASIIYNSNVNTEDNHIEQT